MVPTAAVDPEAWSIEFRGGWQMRFRWIFLIAALVHGLAAQAEVHTDCNQSEDQRLRIVGCSGVITSGKWQGRDLAVAYNHRGTAHRSSGDKDRAIADYTAAINTDPGYAAAYNNRGWTYHATGNITRAFADYDRAIRIDPALTAAYNNRGNAFRASGRPGEALADYDRALVIEPRTARIHVNRGLALAALGRLAEADESWRQASALGGARLVGRWQHWTWRRGHYRGPIDGVYGLVTKLALAACARDPAC